MTYDSTFRKSAIHQELADKYEKKHEQERKDKIGLLVIIGLFLLYSFFTQPLWR